MDNFYDTAKRMHKSSETLHNNAEYHNACYLAGYVVECYAKIIVGLSYGFDNDEIKREFSHDLRKLDRELQYLLIHSSYAAHIVNMRTSFTSILQGYSKWDPVKRYAEDSRKWSAVNSSDFQSQIQVAMQKLAQMKLQYTTLI